MGNVTLLHLEYCTYCPKMCRHTCPVSEASGRETHTPQAKMARLHDLLGGRLPWTVDETAALWACSGCRACHDACVHGVDVGPTLAAGRALAIRAGAAPAGLADLAERFAAQLLPYRARAAAAPPASAVYVPGCGALGLGPDAFAAALALLGQGVALAPGVAVTSGAPLLDGGQPDAFAAHAREVRTALRDTQTVMVDCAACLHALRAHYPAVGAALTARVVHVSEHLAGRPSSSAASTTRPEVWLHDACHLARWQPTLGAPRQVLARVATVREFAWSGTASECCGASGHLQTTMPKVAHAMAERRLAEVAQAGGGTVVATSPACASALAAAAPTGVTVLGLLDYLATRGRA